MASSDGDEGMVDGNVSVPEVTLFYSCDATSGLAQTLCAEYDQFPYAKRHSDVEQSGIANSPCSSVRFGYGFNRNVCFQY